MKGASTPLEEAPPPPPPPEPPRLLKTLEVDGCDDACCSTSAWSLEELLEISRTEFEPLVRGGFYFEEDTLEELRLR